MKIMRRKVYRFLARSAIAMFGVAIASVQPPISAQQPARTAPYTAEQANAGRATYLVKCATCHLPDLKGSNEASPLAGINFVNTWRARTTSDLFNRIRNTMPITDPGSLGDEEAVNIVAYLHQANGAAAGAQALTPATMAPIGAVIGGDGSAPATQTPERTPTGQTPAGRPPAPARPSGAPAGLTFAGEVKNFVPVTDEMLRRDDPNDWLMVRGNYQAWNHSALTQITRDNVKDLKLAWVWTMNDAVGANEPTPLVHTGIIYLTNVDNILQALDGRTGDLIWENRIRPQGSQGGGTGAMRNLAIYQDKLFAATTDAHLIALDARTGKVAWDTVIADVGRGYGNSSGPIVIGGKVIQGLGGCDRYKAQDKDQGCFISAFDPANGKLLWQFNTIARSGEPGGDSWGDLPNMLRVGGETWITGSYDPELNLTYWGVAQAKPWAPISRGLRFSDPVLYTSSTIALNPDDGTLKWYYQHIPAEALDLDEVFERVLVDVGDRKLVFSSGKSAILWKLDRKSGEHSDHKETIFQNIYDSIDPKTGAISYRADLIEQKFDEWQQACPSTEGGKNWPAMTYHPGTGYMIIPLSQSCMEMRARKVDLVEGAGGASADRLFYEMPGTDGNVGRLSAFDIKTMKEVWN